MQSPTSLASSTAIDSRGGGFGNSNNMSRNLSSSHQESQQQSTLGSSLSMAHIDIDLDLNIDNNNNNNNNHSSAQSKGRGTSSIEIPSQTSTPHALRSPHYRERTIHEQEESRQLVKVVAGKACQYYQSLAQPLVACAYLLSVQQYTKAIEFLLNHFEPDIAYAIAQCFDCDTRPIACAWADRCAQYHAMDLAIEILQENLSNNSTTSQYNTAEIEIGLLCAKYCTEEATIQYYTTYQIATEIPSSTKSSPFQYYFMRAKEEEEIGSDAEAENLYILAHRFDDAVRVALHALSRVVMYLLNLTSQNNRLLYAARHIPVYKLQRGDALKIQFLCYQLWFSAHEAAWKGCFRTAHQMLNILLDDITKIEFPVEASLIQYQMLFFMILDGDASTLTLLNTIISTAMPSGQIRESLRGLNALLQEEHGWNHWIEVLSQRVYTNQGGGGAMLGSDNNASISTQLWSPDSKKSSSRNNNNSQQQQYHQSGDIILNLATSVIV
jgi:hypothetical protein